MYYVAEILDYIAIEIFQAHRYICTKAEFINENTENIYDFEATQPPCIK